MFKAIDMFGSSLSLKSQSGANSFQSTFGGILSLLVFICTSGISIFFLNIFFNRVESTIISNFKTSINTYIPDFHNFPVMLKLSLPGAGKIDFPEKTWRLNPLIFTMDPKISSTYNTTRINYQRCTKEMFKGYDDVLKDMIDLQDYFCFNFGDSKFDLLGPYGSSEFHQFLSIRIRGCYKENEGEGCLSPEIVDKITTDMFVDIRILNTNIMHDRIDPIDKELLGQRIPISSSIFKRIFMKINTIDYISDFGYIFESLEKLHINQFSDYTIDTDFKSYNDPKNKPFYKVFSIVNIINNQTKIYYKRTYMKAQTLLANIGGILKGITVIAQLLNFFISKRLLDEELSNHININLQNAIKKDLEQVVEPSKNEINKIENIQMKIDKMNKKSFDNKNLNLKLHETFLPLICFCDKRKKELILATSNIIKKTVSIHNVLRKLQEFEAIKRCVLTQNELLIFEEIFNHFNINQGNSLFLNQSAIDASKLNINRSNESNLFSQFIMKMK